VTKSRPLISNLGERALLITLGDKLDVAINRSAHLIAGEIVRRKLAGVEDVLAANASVGIYFDPASTDTVALRKSVDTIVADIPKKSESEDTGEHVIPVRYDGPDLEEVANETNLSIEEIVQRHSGKPYRVYAVGFAPGFAYLGDLDPSLAVRRRSTPRTKVPPGSVAIANRQTGIYPFATPGGWRLIGTTEVKPFDPQRDPAALFSVGDTVRFEPVR
jgi:KipI family sensor histidine kinase inhibitor